MVDFQHHADSAYTMSYSEKNLGQARQHGKMAHRIEALEARLAVVVESSRQRLAALEKEVADLKESIRTKYPITAAESPAWREHVVSFDPDAYGENAWEEMLVSLGILYGAQESDDSDQVKRTLARVVSIAEWATGQRMVPGEIKTLFRNAKVLYTYFHPDGSEWEAAKNPWHFEDVGQMAASWLRSLYV